MNTIYTLWLLTASLLRTRSVEKALKDFAAERFNDRKAGDEEGSFASLRRNAAFRTFVFIVGALSQVIKIYASTGIPCTKVWCAGFLSTFVLDEVLLKVALSPDHVLHISPKPMAMFWIEKVRYLAVSTVILSVLGFYSYVECMLLQTQNGLDPLIPLFGWCFFAGIFLLAFCTMLPISGSWSVHLAIIFVGGRLFVYILTVCILTSLERLTARGSNAWDIVVITGQVVSGITNAIGAILGIFKTIAVEQDLGAVYNPFYHPYENYLIRSLGTTYVLLHFIAAAFYYGTVYDRSTTIKPV